MFFFSIVTKQPGKMRPHDDDDDDDDDHDDDDDDEQRPVGEDRRIHWLTRSGWFMRPLSLQLLLCLVVDLPLWKMMEWVRQIGENHPKYIGENIKTTNQLLFKAKWFVLPRETGEISSKISRRERIHTFDQGKWDHETKTTKSTW